MEIISQYGSWLMWITAAFGFMAFGIGTNDAQTQWVIRGSGYCNSQTSNYYCVNFFESAGA